MTDEELLDKLQDPQSRLEILLYLIYEALAYKNSASGDYTPAGSVAIEKGTDTTNEE